mmetsp:Transcript_47252/g.137524  ORF Transcript_47252/g.137524 Transcript_47252/m.137524 type:complete len:212 (+) Transcript_47252:302-937(+)
MATLTSNVQSCNVTTDAAIKPTPRTISQTLGKRSWATFAKDRVTSEGSRCNCGQSIHASKLASPSNHHGGKQHPWSIGPKPWGFCCFKSSKFPECLSVFKTRMSNNASASATSCRTKALALDTSRGIAKSSMKPITSDMKAWTEPSKVRPPTSMLAREVTGTPARESHKRSTRYTASSLTWPSPAGTLFLEKFSPSLGLKTAIFSPPTSRA